MRPAGFVLVGGDSSRMGRDKALLPYGPFPLVADVARRVAEAAETVALVGASGRYRNLGIDCLEDLRPGFGPLAGIEAALSSGRGDLNLIVGCDMPRLDTALLRNLLSHAEATGALCVCACDENAVHPLCAVYRSECLPAIRKALDRRRLRLSDIIQGLGAVRVQVETPVLNVNTPSEWAQALTFVDEVGNSRP